MDEYKTTWKEFKAEIDKQLKEKGLNEDIDIFFIDVHIPGRGEYDIGIDDIGLMVS